MAIHHKRIVILTFWAAFICCVVFGSLSPPSQAISLAMSRCPMNDKGVHFCAYLVLASLPVAGFQDRRRGIVAGLSMFLLGVLIEGAQHFAPGRSLELGDVIVNGAGVSCGAILGLPIRAGISSL